MLPPPPTAPFGGPRTLPLSARLARRTKPFRLSELWLPQPAGFGKARFSASSRVLRFGRLSLELIERPHATLGEAAPLVFAEILRLTAENTPYHAGTYMHRHLQQATRMIVVRLDGEPQGFSLATEFEVDGAPCLFINATMFAPAIRGGALAAGINRIHFLLSVLKAFPRPIYATFRTQNPLVLAAGQALGPFYPRVGAATPEALADMAARISAHLSPGVRFDRHALVQRGVLARDEVEPARQRHHDPALNALCDEHLDHAAGDLFVAIARMSLGDALLAALRDWRKRRRRAGRPATGMSR